VTRAVVQVPISQMTVAEMRAAAKRRRLAGERGHAEQLESIAETLSKTTRSECAHLETVANDFMAWGNEMVRLGRHYGFYREEWSHAATLS
jgi:hypothetical protein